MLGINIMTIHAIATSQIQNRGQLVFALIFLKAVGLMDFHHLQHLNLLLHIPRIHFDFVSISLTNVNVPAVSSWPLQHIRQESSVRLLSFSLHKRLFSPS